MRVEIGEKIQYEGRFRPESFGGPRKSRIWLSVGLDVVPKSHCSQTASRVGGWLWSYFVGRLSWAGFSRSTSVADCRLYAVCDLLCERKEEVEGQGQEACETEEDKIHSGEGGEVCFGVD